MKEGVGWKYELEGDGVILVATGAFQEVHCFFLLIFIMAKYVNMQNMITKIIKLLKGDVYNFCH